MCEMIGDAWQTQCFPLLQRVLPVPSDVIVQRAAWTHQAWAPVADDADRARAEDEGKAQRIRHFRMWVSA
jgi:hypothetical protein